MKQGPLKIGCTLGVLLVAWAGFRVWQALDSHYNPDPKNYPVARVTKMCRNIAPSCQATKLLGLDLDNNWRLFRGRLSKADRAGQLVGESPVPARTYSWDFLRWRCRTDQDCLISIGREPERKIGAFEATARELGY